MKPFSSVLLGSLLSLNLALPPARAQTVAKTYAADNTTDFPNPERGMWLSRYPEDQGGHVPQPLELADLVTNARNQNLTVVHCRYVIDEYIGSDLAPAFLQQFAADLATCRQAGVKMVPLFMYSHTNGGPDAPLARILGHLDQLETTVKQNADVIAYWGGGFIGTYGEWSYSSNNLLGAGPCGGRGNDATRQVAARLMSVVPTNRAVVFRSPYHIRSLFGDAPLASSEAFTGTNRARAGYKDHSFAAASNGMEGFFEVDADCNWDGSAAAIERVKDWIHQQCAYTPMEAEPDTDLDPATDPNLSGRNCLALCARLRPSTMNSGYNPQMLNRWKADGVYDELRRNLGYRLQLVSAALPAQAAAGSAATFGFTVQNLGYAAPYNPRDVEVVLRNGTTVRRLKLPVDPRRWLPENGPVSVSQTLTLPADLPAGQYEVLLNLPDPMASLNARPEYAIRLANQNTWESATGYNKLNHTLNVTAPASGVTYYRLKNRWQSTYLFDDGDRAGYAAAASGDAYLWAVESAGGYAQFKNKATGDYLHVEHGQDYVECTPAQAGWWSKDWTLEDYAGYKMIKNRWQSGQYVHVENLKGYAQHTSIAKGTWSSQWTIEAVNSTGARPANPAAAAEPAPAEGTGAGAALSAYPNPSPDGRATLRLQAQAAQRVTVQVYNAQGGLVSLLTVALREGQTEFRLPVALPRGTYYLKARIDGQARQFAWNVE